MCEGVGVCVLVCVSVLLILLVLNSKLLYLLPSTPVLKHEKKKSNPKIIIETLKPLKWFVFKII